MTPRSTPGRAAAPVARRREPSGPRLPGTGGSTPPASTLPPGASAGTPAPVSPATGAGTLSPGLADEASTGLSEAGTSPGPSGRRILSAGRDTGKPGRAVGGIARPGQGKETTALSGEEWRKAAKAALAKNRRTTTRATAGRQAVPTPPATGTPLTATAHCQGCGWTEGPGPQGDVDKAAADHVSPGHATAVVAGIAGTRGAA